MASSEYNFFFIVRCPDLFHPLATLSWEECCPFPHGGLYPQCIAVKNKVYVATICKYAMQEVTRLHVCNSDFTAWTPLTTPTEQWFGISSYHSQLVVVGGKEYLTGKLTNKVWVSDDGIKWEPSLPPLPAPRFSPSVVNTGSPEYLLVAGGMSQDKTMAMSVDVLIKEQWMSAQPLPRGCSSMLYTIHNWNLYFCLYGGYGNKESSVLYANLDSLIATTRFKPNCLLGSSGTNSTVWKELKVPVENSCPLSLHKQMIVIGDVFPNSQPSYPQITFTTKIFAYSPSTGMWVQVGDVPYALRRPVSIVLSSGEMLVMGEQNGTQEWKTLRATIKSEQRCTHSRPAIILSFCKRSCSMKECACGLTFFGRSGVVFF